MATLVNKMNREVKVIIPNMREFRVFYSDNEGSVMFFKRDWVEEKTLEYMKPVKQEWSEEDINKIRSEEYTKGFNDAAFGGKLKEWGEEDGRNYEYLHQVICCYINNPQIEYKEREKASKKLIPFWERLKSLRPSWKPSEEQMKVLAKAISRIHSDEEIPILCELIQQLEKLM